MELQMHETMAWLGDAAAEMSEEQIDRFHRESAVIVARYPSEDYMEEQQVALTAALRYILGETDLDTAGREREATQAAAVTAFVSAQQVARMAVQDGMTEAEAARRGSLDRMTVRKALGKR